MSENKELSALVQSNPIPLIRHFAETNPKALKEQILTQEEGKKTFFISLISAYSAKETQSDILKLCLEYDYDLTTATRGVSANSWNYNQKLEKKVPDYIVAWDYAGDKFISELTQTLGKEKILDLESQGYPLLQRAYKNQRYETIKILEDMGVGQRVELYKPDEILKVCEDNAETLSFYWSRRKSSELSPEAFDSAKKYLNKKMQSIHTASGSGDSYSVDDVKKYLDTEIPKWPAAQQEELIAETVKCINPQIFNTAIKAAKKLVKDYNPQHIPAWINLNIAKSHKFFHHFVDKATPLDSTFNGVSYLENMASYLKDAKYSGTHSIRSATRGTEHAKMQGIIDKVAKIHNQDFWLSANPNDNNHPWFHTACKSSSMAYVFSSDFLNVHPQQMNFYRDQQVDYPLVKFSGQMPQSNGLKWNEVFTRANEDVLKDFLNKTWLYKDETDTTCIEHFMKKYPYAFGNNNHSQLDKDMSIFMSYSKNLFSFDIKLKMFNTLLSQSAFETKTFQAVFNQLKNAPEMNWKNFKLEPEVEKRVERDFPAMIPELRKIALEQMLPDDKQNKKVNKI
jgi:hypothetical protein